MTATYREVKEALGVVIGRIPGVTVYPHMVGDINTPAAVIAPGTGVLLTYGTSVVSFDMTLNVTLFVQLGEDRSADEQLSQYINPTGPMSVAQIVDNDPTLGGVVDSSVVTVAQDWGVYTYAGVARLGVVFPVEVLL